MNLWGNVVMSLIIQSINESYGEFAALIFKINITRETTNTLEQLLIYNLKHTMFIYVLLEFVGPHMLTQIIYS